MLRRAGLGCDGIVENGKSTVKVKVKRGVMGVCVWVFGYGTVWVCIVLYEVMNPGHFGLGWVGNLGPELGLLTG